MRICELEKDRIHIHIEILKTHIHIGRPLGLQGACSMLAAYTGCLNNSYIYHCACEIEKFINNIHNDIMTYLRQIYKGRILGMQCACSVYAALTGCLKNSNTCHCVCEIEQFWSDIHIDILKMHIHRVCSRPAACLQHTCSVHSVFKVHYYF